MLWVVTLFGMPFALPASAPAAPDVGMLPRVIISTDIGGSDPDDFQSMVHYLVCSNRFETEGLISSPPGAGRASDFDGCLDAYALDYPNLRACDPGYPAPADLRLLVRQGATAAQSGDVPETTISPGAAWIIERAHADDTRPLYVLVWGSITDVAQAVHADPSIKAKLRLYYVGSWNTSQDPKARNYLYQNHPDLWWIECDTSFRGMYMGGDQSRDLGNATFPEAHVKDHGHLGALFMAKKADIKMGDTPSVLYLLHGNPDHPEGEHWGGAFVRPDPENRPTYWHDNPDPALRDHDRDGAKTVNHWREGFLKDWQRRMDCAQGGQDGRE